VSLSFCNIDLIMPEKKAPTGALIYFLLLAN
jgi:hypothetical protein